MTDDTEVRRLRERVAMVKDYCEEMFSPEWLASPRNRGIFAYEVYAMIRAADPALPPSEKERG